MLAAFLSDSALILRDAITAGSLCTDNHGRVLTVSALARDTGTLVEEYLIVATRFNKPA